MKKVLLILVALCGFVSGRAQSIIADYPFTNGSINDVTGNLPNSIPYGAFPTIAGAAGTPGTAVIFDSLSFFKVPATTKTNLTNWSIMAHIKTYSFFSGTCQTNMLLEHGQQSDFNSYYCMAIDDQQYDHNCSTFYPDHETPLALACNPNYPSGPTYVIQDTDWHVYICTYDSFSVKTYADGSLISSINVPYAYSYALSDSIQWYIGHGDGPYASSFHGAMDRLLVFNGALSDTLIHFYSTYYDSTYQAPTSVANVKAKGDNYKLFPIPATNTVKLSTGFYQGAAQLTILNIYGQKLYSQKVQLNNGNTLVIPIDNLKAGNYLLQITDNNGQTTKQFNKL